MIFIDHEFVEMHDEWGNARREEFLALLRERDRERVREMLKEKIRALRIELEDAA